MKIKKTFATLAVGGALVLASDFAWAHHSLFADFDLKTSITLKGTITKVEWKNPHGWIYIDVKGPDGRIEKWGVETGSPLRMERRGLHRSDLRIGSEVIVGGFAARDRTRTAAGWIITFTDWEVSDEEGDASFALGR